MSEPVHVPARTGEAYWTSGCMFRFLVTAEESGGGCTTIEATVPPGEGANPHFHPDDDEQFYVLDGNLTFEVEGRTISVSAGDFVHVPRGTVHSFENGPRQAKLLATFSPGLAIKQMFLEGATPLSKEEAYASDEVQRPPGVGRHRRS